MFIAKLIILIPPNTTQVYFSSTGAEFGPGCSGAIATDYGLDGPVIESRWGRDFPHLSRPAWGPPSLLYNGYWVFLGGRMRLGRDADLSPLSLTPF
jgi:hypothetical protein